ncbi:hypothetical protein D1007_55734 [Hordeum vulgare]|nr:hypothetical protein D1007_55734 [Hordeum vulgare]
MRHFVGIWAVGYLIGTTIDVDLLALRRRGVVRILVGMVAEDFFKKIVEVGPYIHMDGILKLGGYEFTFFLEPQGFVQAADFIPIAWDTKAKDGATETNTQVDMWNQPGFGGASA